MKFFPLHRRHIRKRALFFSALALLLLSFLTSWYFDSKISVSHQQKLLQHYVTRQQADARKVLHDTNLLRKLVTKRESAAEFERLTGKEYGLFLFAETITGKDELLFWNSQKIIPPPVEYIPSDTVGFQQLINGYYVVEKSRIALPGMSNNVVAYVLIPVFYKYYLETEKSQSYFAHEPSATHKIGVTAQPTEFPIVSVENKPLFYVYKATVSFENQTDAVTIVLRLTALVFLLILLHLYARGIVRQRGALNGVLVLAGSLLLVRGVLYLLPLVFPLRQFELFDPTIYASDLYINRSLGDLLINAVLVCWVVLFAWNYLGPIKQLPRFISGKKGLIAGVAGVFLLLFVTFRFAHLVNQLVTDSKISFDVINYSDLTIYTAISFLILALLSLSYYYFSRLLFRTILRLFPKLWSVYFTIAVTGLVLLTLEGNHNDVLFLLPVWLWLVFYSLILTQEQSILNRFRINIASILFWNFLFSVSLAALVAQGNLQRELRERKDVASRYEKQIEPTKVLAVNVGLQSLNENFLKQNFHRFYQATNTLIRDSIEKSAFSGYSNAYTTRIYVFDSAGKSVNNPDTTRTYEELNNIYTTRTQLTNKSGIVSYEISPSEIVYLVKREAYDSTVRIGTLFLISTPKQFTGKEKFYPDVFRLTPYDKGKRPYIFSVYQNNRLIRYTGWYPFKTTLNESEIPDGEFTYQNRNDYSELWYKASNHKIIIVARKKESLIESITLFSYFFCAFLFMIGAIRLFEILAQITRTWPRFELFSRLNIRTQIHVTIIFISLLSFLVIGLANIAYLNQRYRRSNIEELSRTATITMEELQKKLREDSLGFQAGIFEDPVATETLKRVVKDISDAHGVIVNIFDKNGTLQVTSDDQIYRGGILSLRMNPDAYFQLAALGTVQKVQEEIIGHTEYESIYTTIFNPTKAERVAFLNIPSSWMQEGTKQEIADFLVTIINLNAFIVLIAGVIALFISNRITRSFSVIGDKMKEITLGKTNEEIEWTRSDEIGELVKQYNKMVQKLEQSASVLAKSEREGAWREMARQVAHEIKNPLTPMKLSIQYLQRAIQNNLPNVKEMTASVASTLIEQIDHLSKIAGDFSQFANIGNNRPEVIDLHNVIQSLLALFSTNPKVAVTWEPLQQEVNMRVDKTHMNRLFTNLLTNAVDACSERESCLVQIAERLDDNNLIISITDNGDGIPAEMQSKIFTPNFTTKTSGTGLGLAMCKSIVEQAGGHIWFETKVGEGTTFFVELPMIGS